MTNDFMQFIALPVWGLLVIMIFSLFADLGVWVVQFIYGLATGDS